MSSAGGRDSKAPAGSPFYRRTGLFADKVVNAVSETIGEFAFADTGTTRVMEHVMGQLEAILALLRATPVTALTRAQRAIVAAALVRLAGLVRGM